ncbi:hypothetical protein L7H23_01160 [Sphingopyxis sp. BSN-002]|uniref:hypothetical protein n=1 Tax=Sphingopyxis sp. BSN-002 TaxID=2911495 RepID=UPI001EDB0BF8|nr:hypothetical protein [Sphingopyxis sp. BSN-002]QVJ07680.1 hypothetical protein [Sphingopyxis phage VSN-002]UKK84742.1 hypothetical protein L7H23_01160 [Sphingopyxis sp. BSN-002]
MGKGGGLEITLHAIERYQQRVDDVPAAIVVQRLCGPAFDAADQLGSASVILPTGHRVIVHDHAVVTVLPIPPHKAKRGRK